MKVLTFGLVLGVLNTVNLWTKSTWALGGGRLHLSLNAYVTCVCHLHFSTPIHSFFSGQKGGIHTKGSHSIKLRAMFCNSILTSKLTRAFIDYTPWINNTSVLCRLCTVLPQITPLSTLTLVCTHYEESNLGAQFDTALLNA